MDLALSCALLAVDLALWARDFPLETADCVADFARCNSDFPVDWALSATDFAPCVTDFPPLAIVDFVLFTVDFIKAKRKMNPRSSTRTAFPTRRYGTRAKNNIPHPLLSCRKCKQPTLPGASGEDWAKSGSA